MLTSGCTHNRGMRVYVSFSQDCCVAHCINTPYITPALCRPRSFVSLILTMAGNAHLPTSSLHFPGLSFPLYIQKTLLQHRHGQILCLQICCGLSKLKSSVPSSHRQIQSPKSGWMQPSQLTGHEALLKHTQLIQHTPCYNLSFCCPSPGMSASWS